jgi:hypothetical protein
MAGILKMWMVVEDMVHGELHAEFDVCGFSGKSSAWFTLSCLAEQARKFGQYPLYSANFPCIAGGVWNRNADTIVQEHLHLSVSPSDSRGNLAMLVRLAVPYDDQSRINLRFSASAEFNTNYEQVAAFARDLESIANRRTKELVLIFS